jgi:hypothetical protein
MNMRTLYAPLAALCVLAACQTEPAAPTAPGSSPGASAVAVAGKRSRPSWVYHEGTFLWDGDFSFSARPYYADKSGAPQASATDIRVEVFAPWGGFQPVARGRDFDPAPFEFLTLAVKPAIPNQQLQIYFQRVGDIPVGVAVNPFKYGPAPEVGQWATYRIPLADFGLGTARLYKFAIQDQTGRSGHSFFLNEIGFLPPDSAAGAPQR